MCADRSTSSGSKRRVCRAVVLVLACYLRHLAIRGCRRGQSFGTGRSFTIGLRSPATADPV
jgi:hypothetical protein